MYEAVYELAAKLKALALAHGYLCANEWAMIDG